MNVIQHRRLYKVKRTWWRQGTRTFSCPTPTLQFLFKKIHKQRQSRINLPTTCNMSQAASHPPTREGRGCSTQPRGVKALSPLACRIQMQMPQMQPLANPPSWSRPILVPTILYMAQLTLSVLSRLLQTARLRAAKRRRPDVPGFLQEVQPLRVCIYSLMLCRQSCWMVTTIRMPGAVVYLIGWRFGWACAWLIGDCGRLFSNRDRGAFIVWIVKICRVRIDFSGNCIICHHSNRYWEKLRVCRLKAVWYFINWPLQLSSARWIIKAVWKSLFVSSQ